MKKRLYIEPKVKIKAMEAQGEMLAASLEVNNEVGNRVQLSKENDNFEEVSVPNRPKSVWDE